MNSPPVSNPHNSRIIFLDYLRIFAFSSVIIGHRFYEQLLAHTQNPSASIATRFIVNLLLPLFYSGGAGVVVFFFVSGYIITHVLQTEKTNEFIIKRVFRIYPLYMFAVLIQNSRSIMLCIMSPELLTERLPILLSQLFLVGDLFGTNYSLYGIEWTLRVEILFYLYMAALHSLKLMHTHKKLLPYVLGSTSVLLALLPPFPTWNETNIGTITIYTPFLLLGAMFYLTEKKQVRLIYLLIFVIVVLFQYHTSIKSLQPRWQDSHFAILALFIFSSTWVLRKHMIATGFVLFASDLTYAAYLLHSWHYKYIKDKLIENSITILPPDVLTLIIFFIVCIISVKCIEKPGILCGKFFIHKLNATKQTRS